MRHGVSVQAIAPLQAFPITRTRHAPLPGTLARPHASTAPPEIGHRRQFAPPLPLLFRRGSVSSETNARFRPTSKYAHAFLNHNASHSPVVLFLWRAQRGAGSNPAARIKPKLFGDFSTAPGPTCLCLSRHSQLPPSHASATVALAPRVSG